MLTVETAVLVVEILIIILPHWWIAMPFLMTGKVYAECILFLGFIAIT